MEPSLTLRAATVADASSLLEVYRPAVENSAASFETELPTAGEFAARIERSRSRWQWLVAEWDGSVTGYAYGTAHRERAAYRWSVEVSAYVDPRYQRRGIARALYSRLFEDLESLGYCNAYAGITLPSDGSIALHRAFGFQPIGTFRRVGYKFGRWHDVAWYHRTLREAPPE